MAESSLSICHFDLIFQGRERVSGGGGVLREGTPMLVDEEDGSEEALMH